MRARVCAFLCVACACMHAFAYVRMHARIQYTIIILGVNEDMPLVHAKADQQGCEHSNSNMGALY